MNLIKFKSIKKAPKILLYIVSGLLILFLILGLLLQTSWMQLKLGQYGASYLSKRLNTSVSIQGLELHFFHGASIDGLLILDQEKDTLLYAQKLSLGGFSYNKINQEFILENAYLASTRLKLHKDSLGLSNFQFIFDEFSNKEKSKAFKLKFNNIKVQESDWSYHDDRKHLQPGFVNYVHVHLKQLGLQLNSLNYEKDSLQIDLDAISFNETQGFQLNDLKSRFTMAADKMLFKDLSIQTPLSHFEGEFNMKYDSIADFKQFYEAVKMEAEFNNAMINVSDLSYFIPVLRGTNNSIQLNGRASGYTDNLKLKDLDLIVDNETKLKGEIRLRGLPDVKETYIFLNLENFETSAIALRNLPFPPFDKHHHLSIPSHFDELGIIQYQGEFTGYYNDFVSYGEILTDLGKIQMDLNLSENDLGNIQYTGEVSSSAFELGRFLSVDDIGLIAMNLQIEGQGIERENIKAKAKGRIDQFEFRKYSYQGIVINGGFSDQVFGGELSVNDENLKFDFEGLIDASKKLPISDFNLDLKWAYLNKLNLLSDRDSLAKLSFDANFNLLGSKLDNIEGIAEVKKLDYEENEVNHHVESIELKAEKKTNEKKLSLKSSILSAEISGKYNIEDLPEIVRSYFKLFVPKNEEISLRDQNFNFSAVIHNADPFTEVFIPELQIAKETMLFGNLKTSDKQLSMNCTGRFLSYKGIDLGFYNAAVIGDADTVDASLKSQELSIPKLGSFENLRLLSQIYGGKIELENYWDKLNDREDQGQLKLNMDIVSNTEVKGSFYESEFELEDTLWTIKDSSQFVINKNKIEIPKVLLSNGTQFLKANGTFSEFEEDTLHLSLKGIDLAYVSQLFPNGKPHLEGFVSGEAHLANINEHKTFTSDLYIENLAMNAINIGAAQLISTWKDKDKSLNLLASLGAKNKPLLGLSGKVFPLREKENLSLQLQLNELPLNLADSFLVGFISDLEGSVSGNVKIEGKIEEPFLNGELELANTQFRIDYLNTSYRVDKKIIIQPDYFGFNRISISDENGQKAIGTGTIMHDNFSNFNYDVGLEFNNFLAFNTTSKDNALYYGKGLASGTGNISGYDNELIIELDVSSDAGTSVSIPLSDGLSVANSNYLIFTNSTDTSDAKEADIDLSGISLDIDLDIRPEAKVQIIFDEQIGDIIKGSGQGKLKLEINRQGDFNIFGQYEVLNGDYLFTLQNVINKKFKIASGSTISWDGDPYEARIDINAIYDLRASLYDLMPEDTTSNLRRRVPVELELQMTNQLLSPEIDFDIRLPSADETVKRRLESILYLNSEDVNRQELNQQVFGLLVLNRFLRPTSGVTTIESYDRGTPGINNGYEFISNQLSSWLSKISDQFDIGVNYRPGDEITNDELDLSLSTEVFNERLILDGNLGYSSNASQNNQNASNFVGEFSAEYKLSKDGRFRLKGFNRSTNNNLLQNLSPYTQGVGLFYREEFDTFNELWRKYFHSSSLNSDAK